MQRLTVLLCGWMLSIGVVAQPYVVPFDEVRWQYSDTPDQCRLATDNLHTGLEIAFVQVASYPLSVEISQRGRENMDTPIIMETVEPIWRGRQPYSTHRNEHFTRRGNIFRTNIQADLLLSDIKAGAWVNIQAPNASINVIFPSTNLSRSVKSFDLCRETLPPISFHQASGLELHFANAKNTLTAKHKQKIEEISMLVKRDSSIVKVLIDGYTDSNGDPVSNLSISKKRGSNVAQWFMESGVERGMIEVRGHGERYPKYSNSSELGRAKNRRVEIRLVRNL
ncbi:OmpA family protein [Vibrio astriarenae]